MMKKIVLLLFFMTGLLLTSCSSAQTNVKLIKDAGLGVVQTRAQTAEYTIALVMKTLTNPFFADMETGARKAEDEFGVDLIVRTGAKETSIEQQIQIIEELIAKKVDGIVIAPGSSTDLIPVLKKAQDSGIKIVNIDNRLDTLECSKQGLKDIPFISVKNDLGAYLSVKEITKKINGNAEAFIIEGIREAENSAQRVAGARKAFAESPGIRLVASQSADWQIDEAYTLTKKLFAQYGNARLVFCANDMMALGVVQYLKETGRKDVLVSGFDDLADAREAIRQGWMQATIDQQAAMQGYMGVKTAVNLLKGETVPKETYVSVKVINNENIDE